MKRLDLIGILLVLASCGVGHDRLGTFTTDNFGANVQSTPTPAFEIGYSRQEGAIEPTYESGNVPAIAAASTHRLGGILNLQGDSTSVFSGGNAAVSASGGQWDSSGLNAVGCLQHKPEAARIFALQPPASGQGNDPVSKVGNLMFATDTTIGFKAKFTASTGTLLPDANLGYKRQEIAIAPVFGMDGGCPYFELAAQANTDLANAEAALAKLQPADANYADAIQNAVLLKHRLDDFNTRAKNAADHPNGSQGLYAVYSPSFLAIANTAQSTGNGSATSSGGLYIGQVFATGKAAEQIASLPPVKGILKNAAVAESQKLIPAKANFVISETVRSGESIILAGTGGHCGSGTPPPCNMQYPLGAADTNGEAAARNLAAQINGNSELLADGIFASVTGNVLTIHSPAAVAWTGSILPPKGATTVITALTP